MGFFCFFKPGLEIAPGYFISYYWFSSALKEIDKANKANSNSNENHTNSRNQKSEQIKTQKP